MQCAPRRGRELRCCSCARSVDILLVPHGLEPVVGKEHQSQQPIQMRAQSALQKELWAFPKQRVTKQVVIQPPRFSSHLITPGLSASQSLQERPLQAALENNSKILVWDPLTLHQMP